MPNKQVVWYIDIHVCIFSTHYYIRVLHRRFYIRRYCQFIEPVMFTCCAFIFALQNIALGGYLDTRKNNYLEHLRHDVRPET